MTDLDAVIRSSLEQWAPQRDSNWGDVVARAGVRGSRRPLIVAAIVAAALVVGAAAVAETIGHGFSDWLEGGPGRPLTSAAQAALTAKAASPRSIRDLDVRELLTAIVRGPDLPPDRVPHRRCGLPQVVEAAIGEGGGIACAPGDQLGARTTSPCRSPSTSRSHARPGAAPGPQATYGLAAAQTRRVVLDGDDGPARRDGRQRSVPLLGPGAGDCALDPPRVRRRPRGPAPDDSACSRAHGGDRPVPDRPPAAGPDARRAEGLRGEHRLGRATRAARRALPEDLAAMLRHPRPRAASAVARCPSLNVAATTSRASSSPTRRTSCGCRRPHEERSALLRPRHAWRRRHGMSSGRVRVPASAVQPRSDVLRCGTQFLMSPGLPPTTSPASSSSSATATSSTWR